MIVQHRCFLSRFNQQSFEHLHRVRKRAIKNHSAHRGGKKVQRYVELGFKDPRHYPFLSAIFRSVSKWMDPSVKDNKKLYNKT